MTSFFFVLIKPKTFSYFLALKNDVTLFQRMPHGGSDEVNSLQPKAWQRWDLEYARCLRNPISCPSKPVSQEPHQITSLHRVQVPPPVFQSAVCVCVQVDI